MPNQNIELSKEGIKISYLRFLSDSAAGQIVILVSLAAYYFPIFGTSLRETYPADFSTEVKILVIILLVLVSSPLGLSINATSWYTLSWLQIKLQRFWFERKFLFKIELFKTIHEEFQIERSKDYFHLSKENWYARSQLIKETLHIYHPNIPASLEHIRGIRTLFRNISFLSLVFFILSLLIRWHNSTLSSPIFFILFGTCLTLFVVPMLVSSLLGFHYTSQTFYRTYILCLAVKGSHGFKENFDKEIVSVLSRASSLDH
ncbi:MAG TPA: hypothetical protein VF791_06710 [Pyrinomonadaceae bacterium]